MAAEVSPEDKSM